MMHRLAYILAASHSGSTLLTMLLGAHRDACTMGELRLAPGALGNIDRYRCSCGALIETCPFWQQVATTMGRRGQELDLVDAGTDYGAVQARYAGRLLRPLHRGPLLEGLRDAALALSGTWRKHVSATHRRNADLAGAIMDIADGNILIDSSKVALRLKYLLRNPELQVKVIRLIRDGRGVALTYTRPVEFADAVDPSLRKGGMVGNREVTGLTMDQAAHQWLRSNEEAERVLACMDRSRWLEVRYEELCTDPDATLRRVFEFLDLDPARAVWEFRSAEHHVIGNGMRLDSTSEIRLDDRWRSTLTDDQLAVFDAVAGDMNQRYGYPLSGSTDS